MQPTREAEPPARWMIWTVLGLVLAAYLWHSGVFLHYTNDDAYITFRYSRFLAEGDGPYFNHGERVEGYTNFLQMLLAAGVFRIVGEDAMPAVMKALGVMWGCIAIAAAFLLARRLVAGSLPDPWPLVAAGVAGLVPALAPGFALNGTSGLETTLYSAGLAVGVFLGLAALEDGRYRWAGLAFAAAAWTRPEGAVVFALYWLGAALGSPPGIHRVAWGLAVHGWREAREHPAFFRQLVPDGALVTAAVLVHMAIRYRLYDGEWLPNTYYAKSGGFWGFDAWAYVREGAGMPVGGWIGVAVALAGWFVLRHRFVGSAAVWTAGLGGALLPLVTGVDWMMGWRLVAPYLPLVGVLAGVGWAAAASRVRRPGAGVVGVAVLALVAVGLGWSQTGPRERMRDRSEIRARGYDHAHRALARWLDDRPDADGSTVALMDIGMVGYYAPGLRILDVTGLTDRHIAKSPGPFLQKQYDPGYVFDRAPRFIVLTLTADGAPAEPPPAFLAWRPWTPLEGELARHPEFREWYVRRGPPPPQGAPWTEILAASLGARRVFSHDYPGQYYLLAVFERLEGS